MANTRSSVATLCVALLLCGCGGGGEMSLTDYVERINAVESRAGQRAAALVDKAGQLNDVTPQDVQAGLERAREIRLEVKEATDQIEPPRAIADLHDLIFDWHTKFISIERALAARAGTAADTAEDWEELSESPEMAAYRAAIVEGKQVCVDFQAELDATAGRGVFADTPWIPGDMKEVVEAVLGCAWFPENPDDVYRYPPRPSAP